MQQNPEPHHRPPLIKATPPIQISISVWMLAILALYLLLFPPPILTKIAEKAGMGNVILSLQENIRPFFQTKDLSDYLEIR